MPLLDDRDGRDVTLHTIERVQAILEGAQTPIDRSSILQRLEEQGEGTTAERLDRALEFFFTLELAVEGSEGVEWTHNASDSLQQALSTGREL